MGKKADLAEQYFREGYNCAQSLILAFSDEIPISSGEAAKAASSFGGGIARMKEVCGALSGMFMVAGLLYGPEKPGAEEKRRHYERIRRMSDEFKSEYGSIVCRDLLKTRAEQNGADHVLTCTVFVRRAADIMQREIEAAQSEKAE